MPKVATNKLEEVAKTGKLERKRLYTKIGKMLPDTKLPKMVMCVENPYQLFLEGYIRKCSCHLRAFRATADVANNGKSVIASKVAIFGNL